MNHDQLLTTLVVVPLGWLLFFCHSRQTFSWPREQDRRQKFATAHEDGSSSRVLASNMAFHSLRRWQVLPLQAQVLHSTCTSEFYCGSNQFRWKKQKNAMKFQGGLGWVPGRLCRGFVVRGKVLDKVEEQVKKFQKGSRSFTRGYGGVRFQLNALAVRDLFTSFKSPVRFCCCRPCCWMFLPDLSFCLRMIPMPPVPSGMNTWQSGRVKVLKLCHRRAPERWCVGRDICRSLGVLSA